MAGPNLLLIAWNVAIVFSFTQAIELKVNSMPFQMKVNPCWNNVGLENRKWCYLLHKEYFKLNV